MERLIVNRIENFLLPNGNRMRHHRNMYTLFSTCMPFGLWSWWSAIYSSLWAFIGQQWREERVSCSIPLFTYEMCEVQISRTRLKLILEIFSSSWQDEKRKTTQKICVREEEFKHFRKWGTNYEIFTMFTLVEKKFRAEMWGKLGNEIGFHSTFLIRCEQTFCDCKPSWKMQISLLLFSSCTFFRCCSWLLKKFN